MKKNIAEMLSFDLYLASLSSPKTQHVKQQIQAINTKVNCLKSLDFYLQHFNSFNCTVSVEKDLKEIKKMARHYQWQNDIGAIINNHTFEALLITDNTSKIIWVNAGFTKLTGYSKKYAINKTPSFLQGKGTSKHTRKKIREQLLKNIPFKEVITNYKKDKSAYECELHIFPLYNKKITHFLALEKEAS
ncbi:MAG: PAS domain-containing protein [Tenacibaculum sp.]